MLPRYASSNPFFFFPGINPETGKIDLKNRHSSDLISDFFENRTFSLFQSKYNNKIMYSLRIYSFKNGCFYNLKKEKILNRESSALN